MTPPPSIFEAAYYERLYRIEERHWWALGLRAIMDALLDPALDRFGGAPLDFLDAGCGTGYLLGYMSARAPRRRGVGIDISPFALRFCIERGHDEVAIADAARLPFPSDQFDLVICIDTIQHLAPAGAVKESIAEMARLLRPGGLLFVRTNAATVHPPLRGVNTDWYRRFRRRELEALLVEAGLNVEHSSYANMLPALWGMLKETWQQRSGVPTIGPALVIEPPSKPTIITSLLVAMMKVEAFCIARLRWHLPFGHSLVVLACKPLT